MNCNKFLLIIVCAIYSSITHAACTVPTSGSRIWDIAPVNLSLTDLIETEISTIESVVFPLSFMGTFTVLNSLSSLFSSIESNAQLSLSDIDGLLVDLRSDVSRLSVMSEHLTTIASEVAQFSLDMTGVFTALGGLTTTISDAIDYLNSEVDQLDDQLSVIIQSAVAQEITVVSVLDQISHEVGNINSILDHIGIESQLDVSASLIGMLSQSYETMENSLMQLESVLSTGFSGTFTVLQTNLMEVCTIESLVEAIKLSPLDISGTYTALNQLNGTINLINSNIDQISKDVVTIMSEVDMLSSKFPAVISKLSIVSSATNVLANNNSAIGLLAADIALLQKDYSLLAQIMMSDTLSSAVSVLASSVAGINLELVSQNSLLDTTSNLLQSDISKLSVYQVSNAAAISELSVASSKLDTELATAFTIESLIDKLTFPIDASTLVSKSQLLVNDLAVIPVEMLTVSSQVDQLILAEDAINSNVDGITRGVQSSLSLASTIESKVNAIESIVEVASGITLNSKLAVINNEAIAISSKMSIVDSKIPGLIFTAQDMVTDFQETWTILQSISNILTSDQLGLQTVSSKIHSLDLSGVYTIINGIIVQESTINTKVDTANSLADRLNQLTDFSTVFTALSGISANMNTINSQIDHLNTDVNIGDTYLGIAIYQRDVGTSGYVITQPGRYYLAEDISYTGTNPAITISTSDVFLDLNENILAYVGVGTGVIGIRISNVSNVYVVNGIIKYFITDNMYVDSGASNLILDGLTFLTGDLIINAVNNIIMKNDVFYETNAASSDSVGLYNSSNIKVSECFFLTNHRGLETRGGGAVNLYVADSMFVDARNENGLGFNGSLSNCVGRRLSFKNLNSGFIVGGGGVGNVHILDSEMIQCGNAVRAGSNVSNCTVLNNSVINGQIRVDAPNSLVAFNSVNREGGNNIVSLSGSSTFLGNFSFNSGAVGNPNNANYSTSASSDITNKYLTINQTGTSKLPTLAGEWYNINMLP